jgi:hypothetical protein
MARARNIKPALFKNEILGVADPIYTLLFESLWLLADRSGRLEDRPLRIKAETFPYREKIDMDKLLSWLSDNGFIIRYCIGGNRYIQIVNFEKHQNPHKNEPESDIPVFSIGCSTNEKIGISTDKIGSARADSLTTDSLTTDSLNHITDVQVTGDDITFESFWSEYPNKTAKQAAIKAWQKLKPSESLLNLMMAALKKQKPYFKVGFIPHPATWLNGRRWEDDIQTCEQSNRKTPKPDDFANKDYGINEDGSF